MTNCRSLNYNLGTMKWIEVKLKTGRIIPALVTTTAIVAGLQAIEAVKILKQLNLESYKNAFLNLSLPSFIQSEPLAAPCFKLNGSVNATAWDRWEVKISKENDTIEKLFRYLAKTYSLIPHDLTQGTKPIYIEQLMLLPNKETERKELLLSKLSKMLEFQVRRSSQLIYCY